MTLIVQTATKPQNLFLYMAWTNSWRKTGLVWFSGIQLTVNHQTFSIPVFFISEQKLKNVANVSID
jgi:hypothetical protein